MQRTSECFSVALLTVAVPLAMLSWPATASVVRCKTPDGRISYQDSSCPNGARGVPVDTTPNQGFRFATKEEIEQAKRPPPEEWQPPPASSRKTKVRQVLNAGERRFILPGLTAAEVRQKFGKPDSIRHPSSSSGKRPGKDASQQWVYLPAVDDAQTTTMLTVKNGKVTHVERKVTR